MKFKIFDQDLKFQSVIDMTPKEKSILITRFGYYVEEIK